MKYFTIIGESLLELIEGLCFCGQCDDKLGDLLNKISIKNIKETLKNSNGSN